MSATFNYRHLHYFWLVAKERSMVRAAERLGIAVQTVSTQVRALEHDLGHALLKPAGRGLALTDAGLAAMRQADQIFALGEALPQVVRDALGAPVVRLAVGVSDGLPKLVVRALLAPVLQETNLRLHCDSDEFEDLLADLALHRLDIVLADRPAPAQAGLRVYSHALGSSPLAWYAPPALARAAARGFPHSLADVPVVLPTAKVAVRARLDHWFERQGVRPRVAAEFEDSALLKTFAAAGMGLFAGAAIVHDELVARYGVRRVGACDPVHEDFFVIGSERKVSHPLVQKLLAARR